MIVEGLLATYSHKYIVKIFLSDKQIAKIRGISDLPTATNTGEEENLSKITIENKSDDSISIEKVTGKKFDGFMMIVKDPTRVRVAASKDLGIKGERTSDIAKDHNAIAAINGGGFGEQTGAGRLWTGTGAIPAGILMIGGELIAQNGIPNEKPLYVMGITKSGRLVVGYYSLNDLKAMNDTVTEIISFDKALVINGKPAFKDDGGQGPNPRTCIGQKKDGTMLLLVLDGRRGLKLGGTLQDAQQIMLQYGALNATNLDGGSSTTMVYDGDIINDPCDPLGERYTSSAIIVNR